MGNPTRVQSVVQRFVEQFAQLWWESDAHVPQLGATYLEQDKLCREVHLEQFLHTLESAQEHESLRGGERSGTEETLLSACRTFLESALDFEDDYVDIILSRSFTEVTRDFVKTARRFDPSMDPKGVYQACRNVWVMNGLQHILAEIAI